MANNGCPKQPNSQFYALKNFAPERWLTDGRFDPEAVWMMPFSAGSRGCLGKSTVMLELRTVLVVLVTLFNFPPVAKRLSGFQAQDGLTSRPQ
jgi:cytochrome P450